MNDLISFKLLSHVFPYRFRFFLSATLISKFGYKFKKLIVTITIIFNKIKKNKKLQIQLVAVAIRIYQAKMNHSSRFSTIIKFQTKGLH